MTVAVLLNLPDDVYRALVPKAARNRTQVHRLIEDVVARAVRTPAAPVPAPTRKQSGPSPMTAEELAERRTARHAAFAADLTDPRHGTHNGYVNFRCRCDPCKEASAAYALTRRPR